MNTYYARQHGETVTTARARNVTHAARIIARKLYGRRRSMYVVRLTDTGTDSGRYMAYVPTGQPGHHMTSVGSEFRVSTI